MSEKQVSTTIGLLEEGATVPFISRYRKELTGSLDEVQVAAIRDRAEQLRDLDKRKEAILKSLAELGKLNPELETQVKGAETMTTLEDIYLPYRPKRKTRASMAREKGLQPLSDLIFEQQQAFDIQPEAKKFIDEEKGVKTVDEALGGARDIIAEFINENAEARGAIRETFLEKGSFVAKVIAG